MKTFLKLACLGIALISSPAHAAAPFEQLEVAVKKYASPDLETVKEPCVCQDPNGEDDSLVGWLRYAVFSSVAPFSRRIEVWCEVSRYDYDGAPASTSTCDTFLTYGR